MKGESIFSPLNFVLILTLQELEITNRLSVYNNCDISTYFIELSFQCLQEIRNGTNLEL